MNKATTWAGRSGRGLAEQSLHFATLLGSIAGHDRRSTGRLGRLRAFYSKATHRLPAMAAEGSLLQTLTSWISDIISRLKDAGRVLVLLP